MSTDREKHSIQQGMEFLLNSEAVKQKAMKNMVMQKYGINGAASCGHHRIQPTARRQQGERKNCLVKQWTYQLQCAILKLD